MKVSTSIFKKWQFWVGAFIILILVIASVYIYKNGIKIGGLTIGGSGADGVNGADGGLLEGKSHAEGGIKALVVDSGMRVELEGSEAILNKRSLAMNETIICQGTPKGVASAINELNGNGVKFSDDGTCKIV